MLNTPRPEWWKAEIAQEPPEVDFNRVMNPYDDSGLAEWMMKTVRIPSLVSPTHLITNAICGSAAMVSALLTTPHLPLKPPRTYSNASVQSGTRITVRFTFSFLDPTMTRLTALAQVHSGISPQTSPTRTLPTPTSRSTYIPTQTISATAPASNSSIYSPTKAPAEARNSSMASPSQTLYMEETLRRMIFLPT